MQTIAQKLAAIESRYQALQARLFRTVNAMQGLAKQRRRLERKGNGPTAGVVPLPPPAPLPPATAPLPAIETDHVSEVDLPAFLDRRNAAIAEDMTKARKAAEAEARKTMPLSGKTALAAIKAKPAKRKQPTA